MVSSCSTPLESSSSSIAAGLNPSNLPLPKNKKSLEQENLDLQAVDAGSMMSATTTETLSASASEESLLEVENTSSSSSSSNKRVRLSIPEFASTTSTRTNTDIATRSVMTPHCFCAVTPCSHPRQQQQQLQQALRACSSATTTSTVTAAALTPTEIQSLLWNEAGYSNTAPDVVRVAKRQDYLSWDDYFMAVAALSALRSKDPCLASRSGACLVDAQQRIVGCGYDGFPSGCPDECLPWTSYNKKATTSSSSSSSKSSDSGETETTPKQQQQQQWLHTKSPFVVHAKVNAILNKSTADVAGARLYATTFPCHDCAKVIVQSRVAQVVYSQPPDEDDESVRASRIMLTMAGVQMRLYSPTQSHLQLNVAIPETDETKLEEEDPSTLSLLAAATTTPVDDDDDALARKNRNIDKYSDLLWKEAQYDPRAATSSRASKQQRSNDSVLSWDDYFMAMAHLTALRSKDPNTQVGACIVGVNKVILALGYNGFPAGCSDDDLPWARTAANELHTKYLYVCHAEVNAILNKGAADVRGATLYVALFPCNECAKVIVQAGIAEVVYTNDQYRDQAKWRASRILLQMAGVKLRRYVPSRTSIRLCLLKDENKQMSE